MTHVFKKVSLVLAALVGMQVFGSQSISKDAKQFAGSAGATGLLTGTALYSMALDASIRAKPYISSKPVHVSRATRFLMNTWPYSVGIAGAAALATTALGLKYYNNNVLTPERVEAFKERTPVYDYYTLGDSSY